MDVVSPARVTVFLSSEDVKLSDVPKLVDDNTESDVAAKLILHVVDKLATTSNLFIPGSGLASVCVEGLSRIVKPLFGMTVFTVVLMTVTPDRIASSFALKYLYQGSVTRMS